jgi:cephalosporin-C deacetylase
LDPETYYYRRVFADAVLAVDAVRQHPLVDPARVAVTGVSQGGGIAIAVSALVDDLAGVMPNVPFLCDFPRASRIAIRDPYPEIARYLHVHRDQVAEVFTTLSYFDGAVLARSATAPALFSVALMDEVCPPSSVYAAYNAYAGPKRLCVYEFNDHEGGESFQEAEQLRWLADVLS